MAFNSPTKRADITGLGDDPVWHPYIGVSPEGLSERLARRFSAATRPKDQGPRRIVPNADTAPALLLATSITSKHPAGQANLSESAPASLVQFRNPFGPSVTSQQQPELLLPPEKVHPQASSSDDADTRRPATSTDSTDFDGFHNGSLLYPKRRAVSTPFPPLAKSTGTILTSSRVHDRRNITDSNIFRRPPTAPQAGIPSVTSDLIGPRRKAFSSFSQDYKVDMSHLQNIGSRPFTSDTVPLSRLQGTLRQRPKRHSIAASDPASTVIGSDDTHIFTSGEEDETEFLSDTAFDSIRTHVTTSSNSGLYTPRIQTIFDKDFPSSTAEKSSSISVLKPRGSLVSPTLGKCHCESDVDTTSIPISAPVPDEASGPRDNGSIVSFPSDLTDDEDSRSLLAELPSELSSSSTQLQPLTTSLTSHGVCHKSEIFPSDKPVTSLNLRQSIEHDTRGFTDEMLDSGPKMNIFDWSEQPRSDREAAGSDGRPRTVHGKHAPDVRGSRTTGRKATSTLHLRSQSVPVTRDTPAANEQRQTSGKFGTWGLGSKGVSEDWDSDFDFEDADESTTSETIKPSKTVPRRGMIVPQAIMERQASLHGQFGQVQELTLLVEELKRLRHQGSFLKIVRGPSSELWKEAEGIVNLATLDDDHHNHSPPGSPSSLTFSFEESEGDSSNTNDPWKRTSGGSWMVSLSEHSNSRPTTSPNQEVPIKPNSVLDLIYQQRDSDDSTFTDAHLTRPKKLPFDTQSLRDLVVRAGVVTRALKDVIRKAEGVTTEPKETMHLSDPPFSRIFDLSTSLEACTN
ncbi:hypothetical protein BO71DRAFT_416889 [Aspergillus ellipticus CBS 707.79]|uniref:Uncharacterized protein n=1 Tax=Aspergillus ellipticus CBS 707.79 TaxID=1448320 RepID=A0A319DLC4_9EURO|nr:hypothetical protein BO71DRAFT_416889 [Aspergillus ellipticus CBS 707.79]